MKICMVLGTRPEIIKLSPIMRACEEKGIEYFIIHTGQHYDKEMSESFFSELKISKPSYNLNINNGSHGNQTGRMLIKLVIIIIC